MSYTVELPEPLSKVSRYGIELEDINGKKHTKTNVSVSANSRIEFGTTSQTQQDTQFQNTQGQVSAAGQTFYYKYVETGDANTGVRSFDNSIRGVYITFTRNSCYISNEKGMKSSYFIFGTEIPGADRGDNAYVYTYQGEQNNMLVFTWRSTRSYYNGTAVNVTTIYFSKDYKRINLRRNYSGAGADSPGYGHYNNRVYIFEQAEPPQPEPPKPVGPQPPDQLW